MDYYRDQYVSNEDIYNTLRREILNLSLPPGHPLPENEVAGRFHVSRTPVRSVFERLKADKFIEVFPRRGTFITLLDLNAIEQIIYMRARVESGILKTLTENPDKMLIEKLAANLAQQKRQLGGKVIPEEFYRADSKFHEICFKAAGKAKLWDIIQQFLVHYTRYRMLVLTATGQFHELLAEHTELFELIKNHGADKIEECISSHLFGGVKILGERLSSEFGGYFKNERDKTEEFSEIDKKISSSK